jgi:PAS domain S-box-containing protein
MPKRPSKRLRTRGDESGREREHPFLEHNQEAWLAAIVEHSDDAIIGKTLDSVIRSWNSGATRMFGYRPSDIIGESVLRLIPPELQYQEVEIVELLAKGHHVDHFETVRLHKDGTPLEVSLSVSPIIDADGIVIGAAKIARDIAESKRLQRAEQMLNEQLQSLAAELEQQVEEGQALSTELEMANEQLLEAAASADAARQQADEANAAKSAFLATMSHELRTPLNAIIGYVDLLHAGVHGPLDPAQREDLARIKRGADTLLRLIDDVLHFAKLEGGRLAFNYERVRLDDFASALEPFIAPRVLAKGLRYRVVAATNQVANIDRARAEQIMLNLLSNAVKFTRKGGIDVLCDADDRFIRLSVRDTGPGIRADLLASIFEPFVQGDTSLTRTAEGTGLGLSISRQLARAMGGDIAVESKLGEGSTFTVLLPRDGPVV